MPIRHNIIYHINDISVKINHYFLIIGVNMRSEIKKKSLLTIIGRNSLGVLGSLVLLINTLVTAIQIIILAVIKLIFPIKPIRIQISKLLNFVAENWFSVNSFAIKIIYNTKFDVEIPENLHKNEWYLLLANHQSWIDCMVLLKVFNRKISIPKFFSKQVLLYVPLFGLAWWALDFPFMKRYSKVTLEKKPHLKGKDLEVTRKACRKFQFIPVSVVNFVEGTRFTQQKKEKTGSPYKNLLKPKAGGTALVLNLMQGKMNTILDITIIYPQGIVSMWQFLCGYLKDVKVIIKQIPVTKDLLGNYDDPKYRASIQSWLNNIFLKKDALITNNLRT